jgi:ribose transport system substrate-binding protein
MKGKLWIMIGLLVVVSMVMTSCAAPAPQVQTVIQTVVVEKEKVVEKISTVEVEKIKEVVKEVPKEVVKEVEKLVEVTPTPGPANPYRPDDLFKLSAELKDATKDCGAKTGGHRYALLTNAVAPFWTAAQIGASRASGEINVPIMFQAPTAAEKLSQQLSMLETFVNDKYNGITFSAIDRDAPKPIIAKAMAQGIPVLVTDSDATGSERLLYIGMSDYDAGKAAGEAAKKIIPEGGKMVGLVGYATAQNAQDRIQGVKDAFQGSNLELVEVLLDDIKPEVALSNAQTAMQKYPDLAGFLTFYSYDGPAACQAVAQAEKAGKVKVIAFDAEPETQRCTSEGVVQAMIGQRVYFYGYLSGLIMYAMDKDCLGVEATMKILAPYLSDWPSLATKDTAKGAEGKIHLNTGVDVIYGDTFPQYKEYLNSIGIPSQ